MLPTNSPRFGAERWPCGEGVSGCGGCDANAPLDGTNSPDCERLLFVVVCVSCVCDRVEDFVCLQMAKAAVMYDARAILKRVTVCSSSNACARGRRRTPPLRASGPKPAPLRASAVVGPHGSEGQGLMSS